MAGSLNPGLPSPPVTRAEKSALRHRPEGRPARRNERFRPGGFLDPLAGDRRDRGRLRTARQAMQPLLLLRRKQGGAAGKRVALSTHLSEGRPSEGTGHGWRRVTGGAGSRLSWQLTKRGSAFSEADDRSRVARRFRRPFDRALTLWARCRAGAGWLPQGTCREMGCWQANGPFARFISGALPRCCAFRSARERCWNSICRAFRPLAVGGRWKERSAEKRDADASGQGGRGSERSDERLSVGCSRFTAHPSSRPGSRVASNADFGVVLSLAGRMNIVGQTPSQDAEAERRWQRRGECVLSDRIGPSEASGVPR